jgi:two-component system cell cycle sensor histidine kinase/response regulator CckA
MNGPFLCATTPLNPSVERILGYGPEELINQNAFQLICLEDVAAVAPTLKRALLHPKTPILVEYRFKHQDGTWRDMQSVGRTLSETTEEPCIVVNSRDVTDSRKLEAQFRQSQKMEAIGQLAGGVAHDFNNILAAIMMQADLAITAPPIPKETRMFLEDIKHATERAANLTRQLLAFGRRQVMQPRPVNLNDESPDPHRHPQSLGQ